MLPKKNRLRSKRDFDRVFKNSRPFSAGNLAFRLAENRLRDERGRGIVRFGFIISNKVEKLATRRNGLRRQLSAIAKDLILTLKPGYDVVVVVRQNFQYPYNQIEIRKSLVSALQKAGLLPDAKDNH